MANTDPKLQIQIARHAKLKHEAALAFKIGQLHS